MLIDLPKGATLPEKPIRRQSGPGARFAELSIRQIPDQEQAGPSDPGESAWAGHRQSRTAAMLMQRFDALADGILMARDLTNEPPTALPRSLRGAGKGTQPGLASGRGAERGADGEARDECHSCRRRRIKTATPVAGAAIQPGAPRRTKPGPDRACGQGVFSMPAVFA